MLCFLHVHLLLLQSVWQLHLTILRISSGAGARQCVLALVFLHSFPIPILLAEVHSLSTHVSESRHGGYSTLQQLKWVVEFVDEKSKVIGIIISGTYNS